MSRFSTTKITTQRIRWTKFFPVVVKTPTLPNTHNLHRFSCGLSFFFWNFFFWFILRERCVCVFCSDSLITRSLTSICFSLLVYKSYLFVCLFVYNVKYQRIWNIWEKKKISLKRKFSLFLSLIMNKIIAATKIKFLFNENVIYDKKKTRIKIRRKRIQDVCMNWIYLQTRTHTYTLLSFIQFTKGFFRIYETLVFFYSLSMIILHHHHHHHLGSTLWLGFFSNSETYWLTDFR